MRTKSEILKQLEANRNLLTERFSVKNIGLFGSYVHDAAAPDSDVDVLVEFTRPSFDNYMDLKFFLEDLFGSPVDLVMTDTLKVRIKPLILQDVVYA
jgi:hypothetical protein